MIIQRVNGQSRFGDRSYHAFYVGGNSNSRLLCWLRMLGLSTSNLRYNEVLVPADKASGQLVKPVTET